MTNGLKFFLAFYILVGQPALLGRMLNNTPLYELAGLNAGIFIIAWIISAMYKSSKKESEKENRDDKIKLTEKSEEKVSRIENDNGVAIVEVEKKEEIVIEANNNENTTEPVGPGVEGLVETPEEKLEEKPEEPKKEERPMKETVTIPKIVQPLTGYPTTKKKRKRESRWGQRLVLFITLLLAVVIALTLWEFLDVWGIPIALLLCRILYLIIGKLFDINGFYNAKKLFTNRLYIILILAGIGYGVYTTQQEDKPFLLPDFGEKVSSYIKDLFETDKEKSEVKTGDAIYIFEGTGEVITDIKENTDILEETGTVENEIENTEVNTGNAENSESVAENQSENNASEETTELSPEESKKQVTMGDAIKSLLAGVTLSTKTNTTFKYVAKSNELYPYFKTAQEKGMIGTDTDPSKIVSCETFITMKGLREGWDVGVYAKGEIKTAYWNKATQLGKLNGCKKGAYITKGNL